jgi:hypothetical protein
MRKALSLSFIVCIIALAAFLSKPTEEACIKKATEKFRSRISYTVEKAPKEIDKNLFAETLEKKFLQELEVADKFLYRDIYQNVKTTKNKIGWAAFGFVQVNLK